MTESVLIHVSKIKSREILKEALKHNLRMIERELVPGSHIDPGKSHANLVIDGGTDPAEMAKATVSEIIQATERPLRKNGVVAVEVVFSLPVNTSVNVDSFFKETVDWLKDYWNCPLVSAVVHKDEANPHLHAIVLPLRNGRMAGSALVGFKPELAAMKRSHHEAVGSHCGLTLVESVPRFRRYTAAKDIVTRLQLNPSWLSHPSILAALLNAVAARPAELMSVLGIEPRYE
jgi:hypothetical protein